MIDLHAHVLPGIDDGPEDLQAALELIRAAGESGTRKIVATSHVSTHYPNSADEIEHAVADLRRALDDEAIDVDVVAGAELALPRAQELDEAELQRLHLGDGPYLLAESPLNPSIGDFEWMIEKLAESHRIVLAHPERCPAFQRDPERLVRLVAKGALCSVTAGAVSGNFGRDVKRFTHWLFAHGLVHNVASDTHDLAGRRPDLIAPLKTAEEELPGLRQEVEWLTETVPAAILSGGPIGTPARLEKPRRSWWRR